jgi:hypothetical protein
MTAVATNNMWGLGAAAPSNLWPFLVKKVFKEPEECASAVPAGQMARVVPWVLI